MAIIENYPPFYINPQGQANADSQSSSQTQATQQQQQEAQQASVTNSKADRTLRKIKGLEKDINAIQSGKISAPPGTLATLKNQLKRLYRDYANVKEDVPEQQNIRDVTFTEGGQGVSKAFELQTPEERQRTAEATSRLQSTKEGTREIERQVVNRQVQDTINQNGLTGQSSSVVSNTRPLNPIDPRAARFEQQIAAQQEREQNILSDPGRERVQLTANILTLGRGRPYEERSFVGKTAQNLISFPLFLATPILGQELTSAGEKTYLTGKAYTLPGYKQEVVPELKYAGKESIKVFDPRTPEGVSTLITGLVGGGLAGRSKVVQRRNTALAEFPNVETTSTTILSSRDVVRTPQRQYTQTNAIPNVDFVISDITGFKSTEVNVIPREIVIKQTLSDKGRTGTRTIIQDIDTGKTTTIQRTQYGAVTERIPITPTIENMQILGERGVPLKFTSLNEFPNQANKVIRNAKDFEKIRDRIVTETTGDIYGGEGGLVNIKGIIAEKTGIEIPYTKSEIAKLQVIEPQVSQPVKILNLKGYETISTGFGSKSSQVIEFLGLDKKTLLELQSKGIPVSESGIPGTSTKFFQIKINQKGKTLKQAETELIQIAEMFPQKKERLPNVMAERVKYSNDVISIIETDASGKSVYRLYNTKDYLGRGSSKPIIEKKFQSESPISLGTQRETAAKIYEPPGSKIQTRDTTTTTTRSTLIGDTIQNVKVIDRTIQKAKLEKQYIVDTIKEPGVILTKTDTSIGFIEKYQSQKAIPVYGQKVFEPNILQKEGYKIIETKQPQKITEVINTRDIQINFEKITPEQAKALREANTDIFSTRSSLSELSGAELKEFAKRNNIKIFEPSLGLSTTEIGSPTPSLVQVPKSVTIPQSETNPISNIANINIRTPTFKSQTRPNIIIGTSRDLDRDTSPTIKNIIRSREDIISKPAVDLDFEIIQNEIQDTQPQQRNKRKQSPEQKQIPQLEQIQMPILEQMPVERPEQQPSNINIPQPRPPKVNTPPILLLDNSKKKGQRLTLEVKKAGKFRPVNIGEDIESLSQLGQNIVDNTARASFRIKGTKGETLDIPLPKGFRKSKSTKGAIVEANKNRINTIGELEQITYSGIRTSKAKRGTKFRNKKLI